jgi:stearoyl-CoA desaturase (delta-9 desaturase)
MNDRIAFDRVDWVNSIFLFFISAIAVIGAPIYLWNFGLDWLMGSLFVFYILATGLSITLGYHRLFSHLSFKAKWPVRLATLVFGACAFENSALSWVSDHRRHHKHTDDDDDPYDISKGFWWAHMGWILFKVNPVPPLDNVADLRKDKLVMWQYRWDKLLAVGVGLLLPTAIGFISNGWVGALAGLLVVGALRVFLVQQSTFFINSLCHTVGDQPYSTKCSARDSTVMAFFTFGEGYHNFHHEFQHDYRNGVKTWCFDPTKWSIWLLQKVGLASSLRRVPPSRVLLAEMAEARRKADVKLAGLESGETVCERARESIKEILEQLSENYHEFEQAMSEKVEVSKKVIAEWRRETRELVARLGNVRPEPV